MSKSKGLLVLFIFQYIHLAYFKKFVFDKVVFVLSEQTNKNTQVTKPSIQIKSH